MADCLFCKIVAGDIPSKQVYADDHAIAFLDINPAHKGHTLVIPRRHVADLLEQPQALTEIAPAIEKTATLLTERLGLEGLNLLSNNGKIAGQDVFHLHVHLIPRYPDRPGIGGLLNKDENVADTVDAAYAEITGKR